MAVIEIRYKRTGRTGRQDQLWKRYYTRTFIVQTDDVFDGPVLVLAACPTTIGQSYKVYNDSGVVVEYDTGSFVQSMTATCTEEDGFQWEVIAEYGPYDASQFPKNPIDWPLQITWGWTRFTREVSLDINGDAVTNSAGDFFDPPLTIDDSRPVLRIVRNEPSFDPSLAAQFKDALNSGTFFGEDPYTWKSAPPSAELQFSRDSGTSDGYYYTVTYEFEFNPDKWKISLLDQGMNTSDGTTSKAAQKANGTPATEPILLDGAGAALAVGATPMFIDFEIYPEVDYSILGLDPTGEPGQG